MFLLVNDQPIFSENQMKIKWKLSPLLKFDQFQEKVKWKCFFVSQWSTDLIRKSNENKMKVISSLEVWSISRESKMKVISSLEVLSISRGSKMKMFYPFMFTQSS
jgi:hypothetical protein